MHAYMHTYIDLNIITSLPLPVLCRSEALERLPPALYIYIYMYIHTNVYIQTVYIQREHEHTRTGN